MNLDDPSRRWEYAAVAFLCACGCILASDSGTRDRFERRERIGVIVTVLIGCVVGWFVVRQGFTRHGARTRLVFFTIAWMLIGWAPWHRLSAARTRSVSLTIGLALVCFVVAAGSITRLVNPVTPIADAVEDVRLVTSPSYRADVLAKARADARSDYNVPMSMIDQIGSTPVLIDPVEISVTWAYGLEWVPFASMQRYIAYTESLDRANADLVTHTDAPEFVLHERFAVIDGRYGPGESPEFARALFCHYDVVEAGERWDLLQRSSNRCGDFVEIDSVNVLPGEEILIPDADGRAVFVSIDFDTSFLDRVATLLLKPMANPHMVIDGRRFRMLPATSGVPALLLNPHQDAWNEGFGVVTDPTTISVDEQARVSFFSLAVQP